MNEIQIPIGEATELPPLIGWFEFIQLQVLRTLTEAPAQDLAPTLPQLWS